MIAARGGSFSSIGCVRNGGGALELLRMAGAHDWRNGQIVGYYACMHA